MQLPQYPATFCDDAVLLLPGADRDAIGASFDVFLRDRSLWLGGENLLFGWKWVRTTTQDPGRKYLATLAIIYAEMPAGEAAAERLFSTFAWIWNQYRMRAADDLIRAEMIIKHALIHHWDMLTEIIKQLGIC